MRHDDLGCQKIRVLDMVDGLAGRFHAQLVGVHVHGGQLWTGDAGEQRVIEGHDGKVFRDAQPQLAAELFQHHGKDVVADQHGGGAVRRGEQGLQRFFVSIVQGVDLHAVLFAGGDAMLEQGHLVTAFALCRKQHGIDHFRGFDEYFSIPYGSETAAEGHWEKGPGIELFRAVEQALGKREIIAEDLGYMSETVRQLVRDSGFPGMKVLEFAFDSRDTGSASDYLPHNYPVNSVAYTGTHDNETLVSWYQTVTDAERAMVRDYLYDYATPEEQLYKSMIALILRSAAAACIVPMQDWLGLDNSARINKPSTVGQNWRWRLKKTQLSKKLQKEICQLTTRYGRMNWA